MEGYIQLLTISARQKRERKTEEIQEKGESKKRNELPVWRQTGWFVCRYREVLFAGEKPDYEISFDSAVWHDGRQRQTEADRDRYREIFRDI